jgi:dTDP-glucose 4,6-dehydratase
MRVLITGGAGFIGSNYVRQTLGGYLKELARITVLDKLTYAGNVNNLSKELKNEYEFIKGDICDWNLVNSLASRNDVIINFAAETHVDHSIKNSKNFIESNIIGVQNLLQASLENNVKTFIQISTDEVYGSITDGSASEDFLLKPSSPYSASKAAGDLIAYSYFKTFGMDVRITRCTNNYGPYQFPEKIIPLFITNLIRGKKIPIYGNGNNIREWIHVDDHCRGIHSVLLNGKAGEVYNIGSGNELSNNNLANIILQRMDRNQSDIEFVKDRKGHDFRYSVNSKKIIDNLKFKPLVNFDYGITNTINWYIDNKEWWQSIEALK